MQRVELHLTKFDMDENNEVKPEVTEGETAEPKQDGEQPAA